MKKAFALLLVIVAVILIIGFLINADKKLTPVSEEVVEEEVIEEFSFSESSINEETDEYVLNIKYPTTNDEKINIKVDEFINQSISTFKESIDDFGEIPPAFEGRKYWLNIWFEMKDSDQYKTVVFSTSIDSLGVHPNNFFDTLTFDNESEVVTFENLLQREFNNQEVINEISAITAYKIILDLGEEVAQAAWIDDGTSPEVKNFQDFYILNEKMVFMFEPYAIGPYALGSREIEIRFDEINTLEEI